MTVEPTYPRELCCPCLQDIADAPRCEHGNIDWHWILFDGLYTDERCDGAPELRSLLDALTEEDDDAS